MTVTRSALWSALMTSFLVLSIGCSKKDDEKKKKKESTSSIGTMKASEPGEAPPSTSPTPSLIPAPTAPRAAAPPHQATPSATGRADLARKILRESLRSSVEDKARFESAPLYRMNLEIDYELFTYKATQRLQLVNNEKDSLKELNYLLYPNSKELTSGTAKNVAIGRVTVDGREVEAKVKDTILTVQLPRPLAPGAEVDVQIEFRGNLYRMASGSSDLKKLAMEQLIQMVMGSDAHGASGGYGVFSFADDIVSMALWYPVLAAYDENGWDLKPGTNMGDVSYFDVSNYEVTVKAPRDVTVIGTGVEVGRTERGKHRTTTFQAGAVREFALQMSHLYESKEAFVDGVKITSWYLRSDKKSGEDVLKWAGDALKVYNKEFGPYPYTELDVVEAPLTGGAGGVEFPGLVTVAKMFYGSDQAAKDDPMAMMTSHRYIKDTLEFVVAHEVAHQWWNAVVGSDSKRHPFVDEALANHSAILYFDRIHGKKAGDLQRELQLRLPYQLARLTGAKDRPVDLPTDQFNGMMEYAAIVYGKGALFFEAMRERFGDRSHLAFIKKYYREQQFRIATFDDLVGGMVTSARDPAAARAIADRWLKQTHADEDIGSINIMKVATYLLGDEALTGTMGRILKLIDHKGVAELAKLVQSFMSSDGKIKEDIDWGEIIKLAASFLSEDGQPGMLGTLGDMLANNPDVLKGGSLRGVAKELAKAALGKENKEMGLLIEGADLLLKYLED